LTLVVDILTVDGGQGMRRIRYGTKRGLDGTENGAAKDLTKEWRMANGEYRMENGG